MQPPELRASDADRERVATVLRQATAEGRLDLAELDERLALVYAAKTYADLEPLTRDLPGSAVASAPSRQVAARPGAVPGSRFGVAIMSEFTRKGPWMVPPVFGCLAFWGGGCIDLRDAHFSQGEVVIRAFALMGGITVIVPEDAEVHVTGIGIMGGFDHDAAGQGAPDAPRIVVTGLAFWGGVEVKRRPSDAEWKRRKQQRKLDRRERGSTDDE